MTSSVQPAVLTDNPSQTMLARSALECPFNGLFTRSRGKLLSLDLIKTCDDTRFDVSQPGALSGALQIGSLVGHEFARQRVYPDTAASKRNDNDKENRMIHAPVRRLPKNKTQGFLPILVAGCSLVLLLLTAPARAATPEDAEPAATGLDSTRLDSLAADYARSSFPLLREILSIPNDANDPADVEKNVAWSESAFAQRGFSTRRIATRGAPLLLAERAQDDAEKTVLIYLQLDGQPVDPDDWFQDSPYQPALKTPDGSGGFVEIPWDEIDSYDDEMRVFARSASDAKGPVAMFLAALDAMRSAGFAPNFNMKVIMDFEEELGSPHLPQAVEDSRELLAADMLIIFDGPRHITNRPTLTFGARGIATITLTTYGPVVPQHSGHFGNYAPNPALRLAQLLASMKDAGGRVTIPGFYDGIAIDADTEQLLRAVPDDEAEIRDRLQLGAVDQVGSYYQEAMQYPSLNIRGMQSGWIDDKVRTIVPGWARAELDIRLVLESDPQRLIDSVREHVREQGFFVTESVPDKRTRMAHEKVATFTHEYSYQSFRTDFDSDVGLWLRSALDRAFGEEPILIRMSGGSIPISPFVTTLGIPAVTVPTVNRDNNQHSPNENLRLGNYREGIKTMLGILSEPL